jgi:hypothetical protein
MITVFAIGALLVGQACDLASPRFDAVMSPAIPCQFSSSGTEAELPCHPIMPVQYVDPSPPAAPMQTRIAAQPAAADMKSVAGPGPEYVTRAEMQAAVQKASWSKGDFRVVPYGTLWGSASWDSQRTRVGDYALWVDSPSTHPGEADAQVDAKSTRIGIDIFAPQIPQLGDAKIDGKVEVDFQGYYVTRNKPGFLLRHAYVEAKNDDFRILVGQTWDVISPLYMPVLDYTAGSGVGNIGYRRAQFRLERYLAFSDTFMITLQGALAANSVTDFVTDPNVSADIGPYPDVQGRAAITLGHRDCPEKGPVVLGASAHIGEQDFDFKTAPIAYNIRCRTWSLNVDMSFPITSCFGVQAELFTGLNLSNYMGGIIQGVDRATHQGIHASGGFCDVYYDWRPDLHSHFGYAIDDPKDEDMTAGRLYNHMIYTNLLYDVTKNLQLGLEVSSWRTLYIGLLPGDAIRVETAVKYKF